MKKIILSMFVVVASTTLSLSASPLSSELNSQNISYCQVSDSSMDSILDDYEDMVDKLIILSKKSKTGDPSALMEYAAILEKSVSLQRKLQNAKSEMTPAQLARLAKIAAKFAKIN